MDKQPTEARQDELATWEKIAEVLLEFRGWDSDNEYVIAVEADKRVAQILSLTVSSGGKCPECKGVGEIFHRGVIDTLKAWSRCTACNGTGQKPIVTKTLGEIIKEFEDG